MHRETALILDDKLLERARKASGLKQRRRWRDAEWEALIASEAVRRL